MTVRNCCDDALLRNVTECVGEWEVCVGNDDVGAAVFLCGGTGGGNCNV
jgi:hypothetical protein